MILQPADYPHEDILIIYILIFIVLLAAFLLWGPGLLVLAETHHCWRCLISYPLQYRKYRRDSPRHCLVNWQTRSHICETASKRPRANWYTCAHASQDTRRRLQEENKKHVHSKLYHNSFGTGLEWLHALLCCTSSNVRVVSRSTHAQMNITRVQLYLNVASCTKLRFHGQISPKYRHHSKYPSLD